MKKLFTVCGIALSASATLPAQTIVSTQPGPRKAIVEEFTGVNCSSCPELGHDEIASMHGIYPNDEFFVIMYSPTNSGYTEPYGDATDFRRVFLDDFYMHEYCAPATLTRAMPTAFINRKLWASGDRWQEPDLWEGYVEQVITSGDSPMNIGIRSQYDATAQTITVDVEIYYHTDVTEDNSLYVFLGEHDLTSPDQAGSWDSPYVYESNIFRETMTEGTWGDPITGPTTAGSLYTRQLTFDLDNAIDPMNIDKVDVLAFVIEDGSTEVYTGIQAPADGGTANTGGAITSIAEQGLADVRMFPNPATDLVTLTGLDSEATVTLTDAMGREVATIANMNGRAEYATDHLTPGAYIVRVATDAATRSFRLMKQ